MKPPEPIKSAGSSVTDLGITGRGGTVSLEEFIRASAVSRELIERFLRGPSFMHFDPEVGYVLGNYMPSDGIDGSATISTVQANGARTSYMYAGRKCRINTYGDSFTQCQQVSDGETWQECLAAHLGEPIRNFGTGGQGVYQAYRRMLREEHTDHGAEYLILYIWGDDHIRSLLRCRHAMRYRTMDLGGGRLFHGNFWAHIEMDLETGRFVEKENPLATPSSLYKMTDPQFMMDSLKDDLALQLYAYNLGYIRELDVKQIGKLASRLDYPLDWTNESGRVEQASEILDRYSLRATQFILDKARQFCRQSGKKLLIGLIDPDRGLPEMLETGTRYDQQIVDYLVQERFDYFDMNEVHLQDFRKHNLPFDEYKKLYIIPLPPLQSGHYNPRGNHFLAYAIKDAVVKWLKPKPITYSKPDSESVDFKEYMTG